jgi:cytochrome c peroxidase
MPKIASVFSLILLAILLGTSFFTSNTPADNIKKLRKIYSSGDKTKWPKPHIDSSVQAGYQEIGWLPAIPYPADNPFSDAKRDLGKMLFFDPALSSSGQIACASCHDAQLGWGDGKRVAFGHDRQNGARNAMTLFNTAYYEKLFWDGRASSLEDQAKGPVADHLEMNLDNDEMEKKLANYAGYKPLFKKAFGSEEITKEKIFKAIATFERANTTSTKSRFDLFIEGKKDALTDEEVHGLHLFRTKARCVNCHNGGLFADNQFHNDGQTLWGSEGEDLGLYNVTKKISDVGKFKTPSLREVANTGPWMHHGNFPTLKDVVLFYSLGNPAPIQKKYLGTPRDSLLPITSPLLQKLNLTDKEVKAVVAFLGSITTIPKRLQAPTKFPR